MLAVLRERQVVATRREIVANLSCADTSTVGVACDPPTESFVRPTKHPAILKPLIRLLQPAGFSSRQLSRGLLMHSLGRSQNKVAYFLAPSFIRRARLGVAEGRRTLAASAASSAALPARSRLVSRILLVRRARVGGRQRGRRLPVVVFIHCAPCTPNQKRRKGRAPGVASKVSARVRRSSESEML